jgi:hypothetical protein
MLSTLNPLLLHPSPPPPLSPSLLLLHAESSNFLHLSYIQSQTLSMMFVRRRRTIIVNELPLQTFIIEMVVVMGNVILVCLITRAYL